MAATSALKKLTLYGAVYCPFVQRARIALAEAGADYEYTIVDMKNKPQWYLDIYPEGTIPALTDESGQTVGESLVVAEYVAERYPEKNLLPTDVMKRAKSRFFIEHFGSKINGAFFKYLRTYYEEGSRATYKAEMATHLLRLNRLLLEQSSTGPFFFGEQFTYADAALAPFVVRMHAFDYKFANVKHEVIENTSRLKSYFDALINRPSVQETYFGDEAYLESTKAMWKLDKP